MPQRTGLARLGTFAGWRSEPMLETGVLLSLVVIAVSVIASTLGGTNITQVVIVALLNLVFVVTLFIFAGNSGIFSFGHLAFAAIGAYASGLVTVPPATKQALLPNLPHWLLVAHVSPWLGLLAGGLVAGVAALVLAVPILRLNGLIAALGSFLLLAVVYAVATNWVNVTGGTGGIGGVPVTTGQTSALILAVIVILLASLFQGTKWALRLRASREDEVAARAGGIGVFRERTYAWVLAAFLAGIGGAAYGAYAGSFSPDTFYLDPTFIVLAMLIVGGLRSLSGAVVGTIFISAVIQIFTQFQEGFTLGPISFTAPAGFEQVGLGVIVLLVLLLRPAGIIGDHELRLPRDLRQLRARRRRGGPSAATTTGGGEATESAAVTVAVKRAGS